MRLSNRRQRGLFGWHEEKVRYEFGQCAITMEININRRAKWTIIETLWRLFCPENEASRRWTSVNSLNTINNKHRHSIALIINPEIKEWTHILNSSKLVVQKGVIDVWFSVNEKALATMEVRLLMFLPNLSKCGHMESESDDTEIIISVCELIWLGFECHHTEWVHK